MNHGIGRTAVRRGLTAATLLLLAVGAWLTAGAVQQRHVDEPPTPVVWTPVPHDTGGLHA